MDNPSTSRPPSPATPASSSSSDSAEPVPIGSPWHFSPKPVHQPSLWDIEQSIYKTEDQVEMLGLEELLEKHVFEDPAAAVIEPSVMAPANPLREETRIIPDFYPSNLLVPSGSGPVSLSKQSGTTHHRRQELAVPNRKVVKPPKDSCYNLPIVFPSMPEGVTKSRVETQIRLTVDLADTSSSSDTSQYDRVGSWNWLKLPDGTTTKKRPRKQTKPEPDVNDILYLSVNVTCASPPHNPVLSCSSCQNREAKRVAKKLATTRAKPSHDSDSDTNGEKRASRFKSLEDTTSIIQFNCCDSVDFSAGSVVLPVRLTCYCRHHREKLGFILHFTLMDYNGRIVGTGSTKPIMITDDHKTALHSKQQNEPLVPRPNTEFVWSTETIDVKPVETTAPSKRKPSSTKSRTKPYDASQAKRIVSRETSVSSSPTSSYIPLTRSPTPPASAVPSLLYSSQDSASSSDALTMNTSFDMPVSDSEVSSPLIMPSHPHAMPFIFLDPAQASQPAASVPTIHRLVPNAGPTHGGIEVTVLGANFHPSIPLTCVFGDVRSSSIQRWSDNTLVCILPPRATAGVVPVWFDGFPKTEGSVPTIFTYSDESDRALMELALQVVGLKMTGKIEDAKNVAMRIVGGDPQPEPQHRISDDMMQLSTLRPLLLLRGSESEDFETNIVKLLSTVHAPVPAPDAISMSEAVSHQTSSGQTLLHLAALLGFSSLVSFLVQQDVDLDMRDRNGFTALHFAAFSRSKECARILLVAGADKEVVNNLGKTAQELADEGFFDGLVDLDIGSDDDLEDEEAHWGDGEEDAKENVRRCSKPASRTISRKPSRRLTMSRPPTPPALTPLTSPQPEKKLPIDNVDEKQRAWFMEMIQRTLAQLPAAPQLPIPNLLHLPQLPGMPAWDVLPQLPVVFPVFVPMIPGWPGWPSFLNGDNDSNQPQQEDKDNAGVGHAAIRLAQEQWRNAWEKLLALPHLQHTEPPPMYSPRANAEEDTPTAPTVPAQPAPPASEPAIPADSRNVVRRMGYGVAPTVTAQEVDSFAYQPPPAQKKKQDRMLVLFWIPILFLSFIWALYTGATLTVQTIRSSFPVKAVLRA